MKFNSFLPWLTLMSSIKYGKGEILATPWRNLANPMLTTWSRPPPWVTSCASQQDVMRRAPYLCGLPSKSPECQPNCEKIIGKIEEHCIKQLTSTLQNCRGHENQGKYEKLSQTRGDEGCLIAECSVVPWTGSWEGKRTFVEKVLESG